VCCAERAQALPDADIETRMSLLQRQMKLGDACTFRLIAKNVVSLLPASEAELKELTMTELENLIRRAGAPRRSRASRRLREESVCLAEWMLAPNVCRCGVTRYVERQGRRPRGEALLDPPEAGAACIALQLLQAWSSASHIADTLTLAAAQRCARGGQDGLGGPVAARRPLQVVGSVWCSRAAQAWPARGGQVVPPAGRQPGPRAHGRPARGRERARGATVHAGDHAQLWHGHRALPGPAAQQHRHAMTGGDAAERKGWAWTGLAVW